MSGSTVEVPAWEWYGWGKEELLFPEGWNVQVQRMRGHGAKPLSQEEISGRLARPKGSDQLRDLASDAKRCAIIIDDMTRPTKTYQMLPSVLDELQGSGLEDDRISFVMASGAHSGRTLIDFRKKLGDNIPSKFMVYNHNPYENLANLGETSRGTPVMVNREVAECDLKVSIGAILPHFGYGFGGGSKMLLPGVAGIESIWANHAIREGTGPGKIKENIRRLDSEEAAKIAGLDFSVNALLNEDADVADLVCGDVLEAHREAAKLARAHYATPTVRDVDVSIGNGYPMANEGYKAYHIAVESVREGGDLVFLIYTPEGCRVHYYNGRFGLGYGGRGWRPDVYVKRPWVMDRVTVVSPHLMKADEWYYGKGSVWVRSWEEAVRGLVETHGEQAEVAVYPYAAMQISEGNAAAS